MSTNSSNFEEVSKDRFEAWHRTNATKYLGRKRYLQQIHTIVDLLPENGLLIDVGGCIGNVTAGVVERKPCRVILFEALKGHSEFCQRRFAANANVKIEHFGLSDCDCEVDIYRGHKNFAWNTMLPTMANRYNKRLRPERVRCVSFDDYRRANAVTKVDVVKIDVEGYEWKVLRGMRHTIADCLPYIECEIHYGLNHPFWEEQRYELEHLFSLGYARFDIDKVLNPIHKRQIVHLLLSPSRLQPQSASSNALS